MNDAFMSNTMALWNVFCLLEWIWFNRWISGATAWCAVSFLDDQILDFLSASDTVSEKACLLKLKEVPEPYLFQLGSNNLATI